MQFRDFRAEPVSPQVYMIFMSCRYRSDMQLEFPSLLAMGTAAIGLAVAGGFSFLRPKNNRLHQASAKYSGAAEILPTRVRFEIAEIPAIRNLLGANIADGLLASLSRKVGEHLSFAKTPEMGEGAITLTFHEASPAALCERIGSVCGILAETTTLAGTAFSCTVRSTILGGNVIGQDGASLSISDSAESPENQRLSRLQLLQEFWQGLDNGEVALVYQPKIDLRNNAISSAEALLRWTRPDGQLVNTGDLIALCEQTGTIKHLTRWTLARAIADCERFLRSGLDLHVFVNVSGSLLADPNFADDLLALVSQSPAGIGIEITETAVIADPEMAIANLNRFAQAGIAIAIDDFGAGLSSLEYLQRLPASELKIDQTFIAKLSSSNRNPLITRATIDLAHALEMRVTAEGVDDQLSLALLKVMGCDLAQGYLISRPLEPHKFMDFLAAFHRSESLEMAAEDIAAAGR